MHSKTSMAGDALALAAATVSALYVTQLRAAALAGRSPDAVGIAMRTSVIGAIAAAALAGARGTLSDYGITIHEWSMLILLGAFSTAVPTVAYSVASRRLPAAVTTSLSLLTPIFCRGVRRGPARTVAGADSRAGRRAVAGSCEAGILVLDTDVMIAAMRSPSGSSAALPDPGATRRFNRRSDWSG
jgi:hypothetical protein